MNTKHFLTKNFEKLGLLVIMLYASILSFAQDAAKNVDVATTETTTTTTTEEWVSNPLYWVLGALVLIIIIALITRGNKRA